MKNYIVLSLAMAACLTVSTAAHSASFEKVDLHRSILKEANFVPKADWPNSKQGGGTGVAQGNVLGGGSAGSQQLTLQSPRGFGAGQLITYEGEKWQYYTAVIERMNGSTAILKAPLEADIKKPQRIWNFYADPDHPNIHGYKSIVDYALRNRGDLNRGRHILLGDSWFDHMPSYFSIRLANKLKKATIINAGKGGNTAQNLLDRFDSAVAGQRPDVVWIMTSTNDYNQNVSAETYARNIQQLVRKINNLGARAIVFNSSVGKPITHSKDGRKYPSPLNTKEALSRDYYNALERLPYTN